MEKCQLSIQNLNNLWSLIEVYAVFVPNLCGEISVRRKYVWRKNDKCEVCIYHVLLPRYCLRALVVCTFTTGMIALKFECAPTKLIAIAFRGLFLFLS